jgi:signal transduction histidine kinase
MTHLDEVHQADKLFAGPGEMRALMRAMDWRVTPVGSVASWPQALKSTVRIILASQYPMVLTWGPEFTQFYNDAYAKLIGSGHPAALGNDIRITLAEGWTTLGPMIASVMRTGIANWTPALLLLMERSGYREEAYFSVSHAPAENDDGEIVGMLAVCSEVTAQVIGERRLGLLRELSSQAAEAPDVATASQKLSAVLADHPLDVPFASILLESGEGLKAVADVNCPSSIVEALPLEEVPGKGRTFHLDIQDGPVGGPWADPVREVLALPLEGHRGTTMGLLIVGVSPARELDDAHLGFFDLLAQQVAVALRNARAFEEERQRAEELAALDKAKTDFFSNVSHEFRTPLTLMLGPLEDALAADPASLSERRADLEVVHRNALRLLRLVNTLLEFSRVEARRSKAVLEPTDLASFTTELASSFRSAVERAGLELNLELEPPPHPVRIDRDMWEKVVLNLMSNALKYTRTGAISVSLTNSAEKIEFAVRDTGTGIPADEIPRIFERFHRIENRDARSFEGTGIGLGLVKELVAMHGGTIEVESEPGAGSRFTVSLPSSLLDREGEAGSREQYDRRLGKAYVEEASRWEEQTDINPVLESTLPKVLLADDNADMRHYITRLLRRVAQITAVADGEAAWDAAKAEDFDLILTDVMMPKLDGFGLLGRLRADTRTAGIPIIMLSARAGEDAKVEGIDAGADDYLIKPFSARELVARVRANLELSRVRRHLADAEARVSRLEAIGQLTGGVAHDFNNLLTAVSGSLDLLSRRLSDRPDLARFVSVAQAGASRGAKLTRQLLAFARRQPLSPKEVDVSTVLDSFLPLLRGAIGDSVNLAFRPALEIQSCKVDPSQLEVAVLNLLLNARDASAPGATIELEVSEEQKNGSLMTCVLVKDSGSGMAPDVVERAVEPFFTTKDVGAGTGLGLSQVYGFAEQSGGHLEIKSELGKGTEVRLWLPRSGNIWTTTAEADDESSGRRGHKILVVEDEDPVREIAAARCRLHCLRGDRRP